MPSVPLYLDRVNVISPVSIEIPSFELEAYCQYNRCIGIQFNVVSECYIYSMGRDPNTGKFSYPGSGFKVQKNPVTWLVGSGDFTITFGSGTYDDTLTFAILSALPIVREVGGRYVTKKSGSTCRMIGLELF